MFWRTRVSVAGSFVGRHAWRRCTTVLAVAALMGLAPGQPAIADGPLLVPPAGPGDAPAAPWHVIGLPKQVKPFTRFSVVNLEGQRVLRVEAQSSYGNLVHPLLEQPGAHRLSWRWRVDESIPANDLRRKEGDDSPIKVCALFDLPASAVPFVERQVLRIARLRSGEVLPAASVCYVWDAHLPPGTVLDNAFSRRIRVIVLRGPEAPLHRWQDEQRDVWADFHRLFGDESLAVPPLVGVAIGADADNTQSHSLAFVGSITLD
jgi:hypothetical protein